MTSFEIHSKDSDRVFKFNPSTLFTNKLRNWTIEIVHSKTTVMVIFERGDTREAFFFYRKNKRFKASINEREHYFLYQLGIIGKES